LFYCHLHKNAIIFGVFFFSFFKVVDIIIDRIISDRETYRKIVLIYPKIAGSNRAQSFSKNSVFSFITSSASFISQSLIFLCGSRRAGKFEFQI